MKYKLFVMPVTTEGQSAPISNKLALSLPLDTKNICYPNTAILAQMPKELAEEYIWVKPDETPSSRKKSGSRRIRKVSESFEQETILKHQLTSQSVHAPIIMGHQPNGVGSGGQGRQRGASSGRNMIFNQQEFRLNNKGCLPEQSMSESPTFTSRKSSLPKKPAFLKRSKSATGTPRSRNLVFKPKERSANVEQRPLEIDYNRQQIAEIVPKERQDQEGTGSNESTVNSLRSYLDEFRWSETSYPLQSASLLSPNALVLEKLPDSMPKKQNDLVINETISSRDLNPKPIVNVEHSSEDSVLVSWHVSENWDMQVEYTGFVVSVSGANFCEDSITSDMSYSTKVSRWGIMQQAVEHCYHFDQSSFKSQISHLLSSQTYDFKVSLIFETMDGKEHSRESDSVIYTTFGRPQPPVMQCANIGEREVVLSWEPRGHHEAVPISGYSVQIDPQNINKSFGPEDKNAVLSNLYPGVEYQISVTALTNRVDVNPSESSNTISVFCPPIPPAPDFININPPIKAGEASISWPAVNIGSKEYSIIGYMVFFEGQLFEEILVTNSNRDAPSCIISDLTPGEIYEIAIVCRAGWSAVCPFENLPRCVCQVISDFSPWYPISCIGPPDSPEVSLDNITETDIVLSWMPGKEFGDAQISGYQVLVNDAKYGTRLEPTQLTATISGLTHGSEYVFQVIALTDHIVGQEDGTEPYSRCEPGPALVLVYSLFLSSPKDVFVKQITGHSAIIGWSHPKIHSIYYGAASEYEVIVYPLNGRYNESWSAFLNNTETECGIDDLRHSETYMVSVQGRKMVEISNSTAILFSCSLPLKFRTLSPPRTPNNLSVADASCTSLKIYWDNPPDPDNQIVAYRLEYVVYSSDESQPMVRNLIDASNSAVIEHLYEATDYLITLTIITQEYLSILDKATGASYSDGTLPAQLSMSTGSESSWLPSATIVATTSGTNPARDLTVVARDVSNFRISWKSPQTTGRNILNGQMVRVTEWGEAGAVGCEKLSRQIQLQPSDTTYVMSKLMPGTIYRVTVEALVGSKIYLDDDKSCTEKHIETQVPSLPLYLRTLPDIPVFHAFLAGYDENNVIVKWQQPVLWFSAVNPEENTDIRNQRWTLKYYQVKVDGKLYKQVSISTRVYEIPRSFLGNSVISVDAIIAQDTLQQTNSPKNYESSEVESISSTKILFDSRLGSSRCKYEMVQANISKQAGSNSSDLTTEWNWKGDKLDLSHFVLSWWTNSEDKKSKRLPPDSCGVTISVDVKNTILYATVEDVHRSQIDPICRSPIISMEIGGTLDHPKLWIERIEADSFTIAWGMDQTFNVPIDGFEAYVDNKKIRKPISALHSTLRLSSKINQLYAVQLKAISASNIYKDSDLSPALEVYTGAVIERYFGSRLTQKGEVENFIPIDIIENSGYTVGIAWPQIPKAILRELQEYRLLWSSEREPEKHEISIGIKQTKFILDAVIQGTTYYIRLLLISRANKIVHQSKEMSVVTSAPPAKPELALKAANMKYVQINWDKPTEYGHSQICSYTVMLDGVAVAQIPADKLEYTAAGGKACQQYVFQVRANSTLKNFDSPFSEPLMVSWPGIKPPQLIHIPTASRHEIKVEWQRPQITGGVRIASMTLQCIENAEPVHRQPYRQILGPLHPDCSTVLFTKLPESSTGFIISMKINLHGFAEQPESEPLTVHSGRAPSTPILNLVIIGQAERAKLENTIAELCLRRDRFIQCIYIEAHECQYGICDLSTNFEMYQLSDTLYRIEQLLAEALTQIEDFTGKLRLGLSWTCPGTGEGAPVGRYRIYVDGQQYGSDIPASTHCSTVELSLHKLDYQVNVRAIAELPEIPSLPSNTVAVRTDKFQPLNYFCLHQIHRPNAEYPDAACCFYKPTWSQEVHTNGHTALCPGPIHSQRYFPSLSAVSVEKGTTVQLLSIPLANDFKEGTPSVLELREQRKFRKPKILLVWTPWCQGSQKYLSYFVGFAEKFGDSYCLVTCAYDPTFTGPAGNKPIKDYMSKLGFFKPRIKHVVVAKDICEILAVYGVPTFILVHGNGVMAWQGRIFARNQSDLEKCLLHHLSRMIQKPCQVQQCNLCEPLLLAVSSTEKQVRQKLPATLPLIKRPLEVSPYYPPTNLGPYYYDPFLARWSQYTAYRTLNRRRVPWYFYNDKQVGNRGPGGRRYRNRSSDTSGLPSLRSSNLADSSEGDWTSSSPKGTLRIPWYKPRRSNSHQQVRTTKPIQESSTDRTSSSATSGELFTLKHAKRQLEISMTDRK